MNGTKMATTSLTTGSAAENKPCPPSPCPTEPAEERFQDPDVPIKSTELLSQFEQKMTRSLKQIAELY